MQRSSRLIDTRIVYCADCLTVYDDYGKVVNQIREFQ
jgi:hypothetical protein